MGIRKRLATAAAVVALCAAAPAAWAETLGSALTSAYNNSGLLDQNRALLRAADEDVAQAIASLRPVINWSATYSTGFVNGSGFTDISETYGVTASLTLYDGGASQMAVDATKEAVLGTRQSLISIEQDVLLRGISAYLNVLSSQEFVNLRQSNVRVLTQELRAAKDRFEVGEVTRTDVSLAEAELAAARSLLAVAEGNLINARAEYASVIGRPANSLNAAPRASVSNSVAQARSYATRNHPDVKEIQHAVAASEINVRRAQASLSPSVNLSGGVNIAGNHDTSGSVSVTVGGPIYQGGRIASGIRQTMANRDANRAALRQIISNVDQTVVNAYSGYQVAQAASEAYERQVRAAQLAFEGVREEANAGSRTTIDVLNAEQTLLEARANLVSARADLVLSTYNILYAMGMLTAENLDLNVQPYDVIGHYELVKDAPIPMSEQGKALERVLQSLK